MLTKEVSIIIWMVTVECRGPDILAAIKGDPLAIRLS